mgnify:CR=1 FL=1
MFIELLWLIPVMAAALFLPIIIFAGPRRTSEKNIDRHTKNLAREVERFNEGDISAPSPAAERRLSEIELTINRVSDVLSSQQKIIREAMGKDAGRDTELLDIKEKLRELQREYDIVISENYSLRARLKKLMDKRAAASAAAAPSAADEIRGPGDIDKGQYRSNMQLYDDTRMLRQSDLNDTSEIELSQLH